MNNCLDVSCPIIHDIRDICNFILIMWILHRHKACVCRSIQICDIFTKSALSFQMFCAFTRAVTLYIVVNHFCVQ